MRKIFSFAVLITYTLSSVISRAQISTGGLPKSMYPALFASATSYVPVLQFAAPDPERLNNNSLPSRMDPQPYRAGILTPVDISFPASGVLHTLADGSRVWRTQVLIPEAPSIAFYYDRFQLPEGARLFISNKNGKQVLGAYTSMNNSADNRFANQEVQGELVNIELNIDQNVSLDDIQIHINQAAVLYRSVEYLRQYESGYDEGIALRPTADFAAGSSSVCEVNAICPAGSDFEQQRRATVRIIMPAGEGYVTFCSGTLVNNTSGDCTPYVLTAAHCEGGNSRNDITYSQWLFYFNFESPDCSGLTTAPNNLTLSGASFVARADYDSNSAAIIGDFLLLKLRSAIPARYNTYFAGWNIASDLPSTSRYISFHHPAGDMKKLAVAYNIYPNGTFNQYQTRATHWALRYDIGGSEGGSSGSALFDNDGRIVGILSGGSTDQGCTADTNSLGEQALFGVEALYSKISRNWVYPEGNGASYAQLKPWLDPGSTGITTTNTLKATTGCYTPSTAITNHSATQESFFSIYPNPSVNGQITLKTNFTKPTWLNIQVFDINGRAVKKYIVENALSQEYMIDLAQYPSGTYMVSVRDRNEVTYNSKVVITR